MNKRWLIVPVALAPAGAAAYAYFHLRPQPYADVLRVSGNVEVTDVEVSFRIPGWVEARLVSEGDAVEAGRLIALLEPPKGRPACPRGRLAAGARTANRRRAARQCGTAVGGRHHVRNEQRCLPMT